MQFPAKKNAGCPKVSAISRHEKMALSSPSQAALGLQPPLPPPESVRADGRTLTSEPKFLGSIGYQISLPMVLRSAAYSRKGAPLRTVNHRIPAQ